MFKDNIFSASRFMNLCRKNMVESWKVNLLRVVLMYAVMAVIFVWSAYFDYKNPLSNESIIRTSLYVFLWFGTICGCISASLTMENMKSKTSRLSALMTPATPFEKFFSRWLVSTIVYIVVFIIAFTLADYTRVVIYSIAYPEQTIAAAQLKYLFATSGDYAIMQNGPDTIGALILLYFVFQSCFILGSSIWPKNSLIKTFVAGFAIILLQGFIVGGVAQLLFNNPSFVGKVSPQNYEQNFKYLGLIWGSVIVLFNWILAYFRFKESEIINRL